MENGSGLNVLEKWPSVDRGSIEDIKQWLTTQPHLPQIDEHDVALFLHANYGDQDACRRTIENYYTLRTSHRDCFANRDVFNNDIQTAMKIMSIATLPGETKDGYKMMFSRLRTSDTSEFNHAQILKLMAMCLDLWVKLEGDANGHVMLMDMQGMHLGHLTKLNMTAAKKHMFYVQEALPIRIKRLHSVNVFPLMNRVMSLMRPFMRKDIQEMMNMHQGVDRLHETIPVESLPNEYGGTAGTFQELAASYEEKLYANSDWFRTFESQNLVDETKRPPKPRRFMFGLFG